MFSSCAVAMSEVTFVSAHHPLSSAHWLAANTAHRKRGCCRGCRFGVGRRRRLGIANGSSCLSTYDRRNGRKDTGSSWWLRGDWIHAGSQADNPPHNPQSYCAEGGGSAASLIALWADSRMLRSGLSQASEEGGLRIGLCPRWASLVRGHDDRRSRWIADRVPSRIRDATSVGWQQRP
jgi:hypothetical protein